MTGEDLAETILPAPAIAKIKQHDTKGAFDLFGPVIGSDISSGSAAAATGQGQQNKSVSP